MPCYRTPVGRIVTPLNALAIALMVQPGIAAWTEPSERPAQAPGVAFAIGAAPGGPKSQPERGRVVIPKDAALRLTRDIYNIEEDGSGEMRLTYDISDDPWPSVSPDRRRIAYVGEATRGVADGHVIHAGASSPRRITSIAKPTSRSGRMRWSPDGKRIATSSDDSDRDGDSYPINPSNGAVTQLTAPPEIEAEDSITDRYQGR